MRKIKPVNSREVGLTTISCPGANCPFLEVDWSNNKAVLYDDFGGRCEFSSLSQLWALTSRINVQLCGVNLEEDI